MHTYVRRILVALVVVGLGFSAAQAEEEGPALETRLYRVGALTAGNVDFIPHAFPLCTPDMVSDEENPLFGSETEEPRWPLGLVDEVIELVVTSVSPTFWNEVEGAEISAIHGQRLLLVKATPAIHEEVERFLAALERQVLTTVAVDVQAVRTPVPAGGGRLVLEDEDVAALLSGGRAGPALHFTALAGQRAFAFDGAETAYLQDGDVEVAQEAGILDPIVGVMAIGLSTAVRAMPSGDGLSVRLEVDVLLSALSPQRSQSDKRGFRYDLPEVLTTSVRTSVSVPAGAWVLLDGQIGGVAPSGWSFLVRALPLKPAPARRSGSIALPRTPATPPGASMGVRLFDVDDLLAPNEHRVRSPSDIVPSNFTPPEPPEVPEGDPALSSDALVQLLVETVAPTSWQEDGASLRPWTGRYLRVRNTPAVLAAVAQRLDLLRRALLGSTITTLEVVNVPADLAGRLAASDPEPGAPLVLVAAGRRLLDEAIEVGEAHRIDGARVTCASGVRNHVASGRSASYLQDYEVEIKGKHAIPNPVVQTLFSGIVLDVVPTLTSDLSSVHLEFRMDRTRLAEPVRVLETPHGGLDLPTLQLLRVRSGLTLPLGRTAIVAAAGGEGGRRALVLLTVHWVPCEGSSPPPSSDRARRGRVPGR